MIGTLGSVGNLKSGLCDINTSACSPVLNLSCRNVVQTPVLGRPSKE